MFNIFIYAPISVKPGGVGGGGGCGFNIFQKFAVEFPAGGQIFPVKCNQISPPWAEHCCQISQDWTQERHNKNVSKYNSAIFIYITLLHHQRYMFLLHLQLYVLTIIRVTLRIIQKPLGESPHFVSLNIPFLVKGKQKVSFISLQ